MLDKEVPYAWFKGLTEEKDKEEFSELLKNNNRLFRALLRILAEKYEAIERKGLREDDYATAGWTHLQAFRNGQLSMISDIADLCNFISSTKKDLK